MSPLTVLAVVSTLLAAASGANVRVRTFGASAMNKHMLRAAAPEHLYPHQVSVQMMVPDYDRPLHICGGALIAENWVLTAAKCLHGVPSYATLTVVAGIYSQTEDQGQRLNVVHALEHSSYNRGVWGGAYDIGLLKLDGNFTLNDDVQLALLPKQDELPNGDAIFTGWAYTTEKQSDIEGYDTLQQVTLPLVNFDDCSKFVAKNIPRESVALTESMLCAGKLDRSGLHLCAGDIGGPLIQRSDLSSPAGTTVIGIETWGEEYCSKIVSPSVFTRVSAYADWIEEVTEYYKDI